MFEGFKKKVAPVDGHDAENVVPMASEPKPELGFVVRDSLGNVVGNAATAEEARHMEIQANIDRREAA